MIRQAALRELGLVDATELPPRSPSRRPALRLVKNPDHLA
jgi:hypothetical protein